MNGNGIITTIAGNGTHSYSGDGGPATNASLNDPLGLALDGLGNLFIADSVNRRVRLVGTNGIITTFAGDGSTFDSGGGSGATNIGLQYPSGVAVDPFGELFIADSLGEVVDIVAQNGTISAVGTSGPDAVTFDSFGTLFIAEVNLGVGKVFLNGYPTLSTSPRAMVETTES